MDDDKDSFSNATALKQRELNHRKKMVNAWHKNKNPFDTAKLFDQLVFSFFTPLMKRGYKQDLVPVGMLFRQSNWQQHRPPQSNTNN